MRTIFDDFLKKYLTEYYEDGLEVAVDVHADLSKDKKNLTEDIEDLNKEIEDNTKEIGKLKEEIEENTNKIEEKTKKLKELEVELTKAGTALEGIKEKKQGVK